MELTVEELAIYGVIDAETYVRLSEAVITGVTTIRDCFPLLDAPACERIRARAAALLLERWAAASAAAD
jgi:hypothetical protein